MLPAPEVPAAGIEELLSVGDVVLLPFPVRQHDLPGVSQPLRPEEVSFRLLTGRFRLPLLLPGTLLLGQRDLFFLALTQGEPRGPGRAQDQRYQDRRQSSGHPAMAL